MAYSVLITKRIMASNVDSLVRDGVSASQELQNGFIVQLATKSSTAGEGEVWNATAPATNNLNGLWMVNEPVVVEVKSADGVVYKGINPDPRNFSIPAKRVFSAFKPQPGDLIQVTEDALGGTKSTNTFVNAAGGSYTLTWGATQTANALSFKLIEEGFVSIGSGVLGSSQRVTTYLFQCIAN